MKREAANINLHLKVVLIFKKQYAIFIMIFKFARLLVHVMYILLTRATGQLGLYSFFYGSENNFELKFTSFVIKLNEASKCVN